MNNITMETNLQHISC